MKRGVRSRDDYFTVFALANATQHSRLGVTVSRRVAALAVVRNRIKRHIREAFRRVRASLPAVDIVILANSAAATADATTLRRSLAHHLSRIQRLCAACH
jgi:ribonuclease P protein component